MCLVARGGSPGLRWRGTGCWRPRRDRIPNPACPEEPRPRGVSKGGGPTDPQRCHPEHLCGRCPQAEVSTRPKTGDRLGFSELYEKPNLSPVFVALASPAAAVFLEAKRRIWARCGPLTWRFVGARTATSAVLTLASACGAGAPRPDPPRCHLLRRLGSRAVQPRRDGVCGSPGREPRAQVARDALLASPARPHPQPRLS